jgi:hypothetical protein
MFGMDLVDDLHDGFAVSPAYYCVGGPADDHCCRWRYLSQVFL